MPESGTSGLMSGVGKRGGASASVLAPNLDSTNHSLTASGSETPLWIQMLTEPRATSKRSADELGPSLLNPAFCMREPGLDGDGADN